MVKLETYRNKPKKTVTINEDYETDRVLNEEKITIDRRIFNHNNFTRTYPPNPYHGFSVIQLLYELYVRHFKPSGACVTKQIRNRFPIIRMFKTYRSEYLLPDLLAGITIGITHIPQGLGFALLAKVPPIYGLYTSFFPVFLYLIFGTSKHLSIGTVAVVSLIIGNTLTNLENKYAPPVGFNLSDSLAQNGSELPPNEYLSYDREKARIMIVMANAFGVGVVQIIMFFLQLGFVTSYLSEPLVNGFLSGSAVHVVTSQLTLIFGVGLNSYSGPLKIPKTIIDFLTKLGNVHLPTVILSAICITILLLVKIHINERFSKKLPAPVPIDLILVVLGTAISFIAQINTRFKVTVIGTIPAGIPGPQMPPLFILKDMIVDCFMIAIVAFATNFSLADVFSKKHHYKINASQELLAYGASNIFASFFPCFAGGASLPRTCIQDESGGKTQVVSIVSCILVGLVLAFIAPLFEQLPRACLAAIIVVSLKNLFIQLKQLNFYYKVNKIEFFQFLITFLATTVLDIDIGLGIGVVFYILAHTVRSSQPYSTLLGNIPGTEIYKDIKLYRDAHQLHDIKIIRVQDELHATNAAVFKKIVHELTDIKPQFYIAIKNKLEAKRNKQTSAKFSKIKKTFARLLNKSYTQEDPDLFRRKSSGYDNDINLSDEEPKSRRNSNKSQKSEPSVDAKRKSDAPSESIRIKIDDADYDDTVVEHHDSDIEIESASEIDEDELAMPELPIKYLIIDCSPINFIDSVGVKTIKNLINDYHEIGIKVYLAELNDAVRSRFKAMESAASTNVSKVNYLDDNILFMSIHDAVLHAMKTLKNIHNSKPVRF